MRICLVAVHYDTPERKSIVGFRLLDTDSMQVIDQVYSSVEAVIKSGKATIDGIEIDKNTGKLKGSNGSLDRYSSLCNAKPIKNCVTILNSIDDLGYRVCNYKGAIMDSLVSDVVRLSDRVGIANGKVVDKNGKKFISAISGTYKNIPVNQSTLFKDSNNKLRLDDKEYTKVTRKYTLDRSRLPKVITGTKNPNSKLKEFDPNCNMTVEQKMTFCMIAMKQIRPFYYSVYSCLNRVEANPKDGIDTLAVSLDTLYFNSNFVLELSLPELLFIMLHEVSHIAMLHRARENGRNHKIWNYACDYFVNKQLADEFGLKTPGEVKIASSRNSNSQISYKIALPTSAVYNEKVDINTDTPEKIYIELMEQVKENAKQQKQNGSSDGSDGEESEGECSGSGSGQSGQSGSGSGQSDGNENEESGSSLEDFANGKQQSEGIDLSEGEGEGEGEGSGENGSNGNKKKKSGNGTKGDGTDEDGEGSESKNKGDKGKSLGKFRGKEIPQTQADIVDDDSTNGMSDSQMKQNARSLLNRAVTVHKQSHHFGGDAGDWIERYVERALAPKVNWVALLRNKLTFASQTITTFSKPDKRFVSRKMTLPGPKKLDNDSLENVKICIDTSGSISSKDIGIALAQIEQLFKQYHAEAELMYWDTDIRAIYEFKNVQELVKLKPMGGGGTDANCIFRYFEENKDYKIGKKKKPTIIIVFTDGYFGQIDKAYKKYKDTIWVVNGDKDFTPPFGSTARFKNED